MSETIPRIFDKKGIFGGTIKGDVLVIPEDRVIINQDIGRGVGLKFTSPRLYLTVNGRMKPGSYIEANCTPDEDYAGPNAAWVEFNGRLESGASLALPIGVLCLGENAQTESNTELDYRGEYFEHNEINEGRLRHAQHFFGDDPNWFATEINGDRIFTADPNTGLPDLQQLWNDGRRPNSPQMPDNSQQWQRPDSSSNY